MDAGNTHTEVNNSGRINKEEGHQKCLIVSDVANYSTKTKTGAQP